MPKNGYKSVTIREEIYNNLKREYHKKKHDLYKEGVNSFAAYITSLLYREAS